MHRYSEKRRYAPAGDQCNCESTTCGHGPAACQGKASADKNMIMYVGPVCDDCYRKFPAEYKLPKDRGRCTYHGHEGEDEENRDLYLYPVPGKPHLKVCESCKSEIAFEKTLKEVEARTRYKCDRCPEAFREKRDLDYHKSLKHTSITGKPRW